MACFLFEYEFWQRFRQDLYMFCAKNCFCNAKFSEFGDVGGGGGIFLTKPPKGTSLPLILRILSHRSCKSIHVFLLQACARKKGTLQKVTERYFTYLQGISHPTKFNQN